MDVHRSPEYDSLRARTWRTIHWESLCLHLYVCVSLRKSKIGFLNPKESENGFCVSLLNRLIQGLSDHGASKKPPKIPLPEFIISVILTHNYPRDLGLICLVKKRKIRFRILSDLRIQSLFFLKKRTLNQQHVRRCCNFSFVSNLIDLFGAKSESENF